MTLAPMHPPGTQLLAAQPNDVDDNDAGVTCVCCHEPCCDQTLQLRHRKTHALIMAGLHSDCIHPRMVDSFFIGIDYVKEQP